MSINNHETEISNSLSLLNIFLAQTKMYVLLQKKVA